MQSPIYSGSVGSEELRERAAIAVARARIAVRGARRELSARRGGHWSPMLPAVDGAEIVPLPKTDVARAAENAGINSRTARLGLRSGSYTGYRVTVANSASGYLCRYDGGTATTELLPVAGPRGVADPAAVDALAHALLMADPDLRRVAISLPPASSAWAVLVALGFADEGWTPPPTGGVAEADGGDWRLFTLLASGAATGR